MRAPILYFKVDDIDATYETLSNRGVSFEGKPALIAPMQTYDLWLAEFRDSEGTVMALMCERPKT
jgi:predicted enzyme related to lactoylglutathione lyase